MWHFVLNPSRRTFLSVAGSATVGGLALAGCTAREEPNPSPSTSPTPSPTPEASANSSAAAGGLADEILADKPVLFLPMQEDHGAKTMADASGADHGVKLVGDRWWANDALVTPPPDAVGRSWSSGDGLEECHLTVSDPAQVLADPASTGVSVELWWLGEQLSWRQSILHLAQAEDGAGWRLGIKQDGTGLSFDGPDETGAELGTAQLKDNAWHHLVCSIAPDGTVAGWVDGKPAQGTGTVAPFKGKPVAARLGGLTTGGGALSGNWSHLAIYAGVLDQARVQAHHQASLAPAAPPVRGVDPWFGGPAAFYKDFENADWFADDNRFPIAEWWMNCANPEEFTAEKAFVDGAVVIDPKNRPEDARKAGMWIIRTIDMEANGTPGAETVGWLPSDEPDMDETKAAELPAKAAKVPDGYLSYVNYGTGVTIGTMDRYKMSALIRDDIHQYSADLYSYCVHAKMVEQVSSYWKIKPDQVRRAIHHGKVVERMRAFLTEPRPVWGVVAIGHPNPVMNGDKGWASVPSANEVEGAVMSCVIAGASGLLLFPQSFPDEKQTKPWSKSAEYQAGDTVRDTEDEWKYWWARTKPARGVHPQEVTDDSWLSWKPNPFGIRDEGHYARGVSDRVKTLKQRLGRLAPVLNTQAEPRTFHPDLYTRYWPQAPDGKQYLAAMQELSKTSGEYEVQLPEGIKASEVEVVDEDRTIAVAEGRFTDRFEAEWSSHVYRWSS